MSYPLGGWVWGWIWLDGFQGMWIGFCRGWVWELGFVGDVRAMNRRSWRRVGLCRREGEFEISGGVWIDTCRASSRWAKVRSEWDKRRQGRKLSGAEGKTAASLVGVWGGAPSLSRWCVGWSWSELGGRTMWSVWGVKIFGNGLKVKWVLKFFYGFGG